MEGWIIYWDWANDAASKRDKVVGVLPADTNVAEVARHLERLYALNSYTLQEIVSHAAGQFNAYAAEINPSRTRVHCGANPSLEASLVKDIRVESDGDFGPETIFWTETFSNGLVEQQQYKRTKTGRLSFEGAWDRSKSKPKEFAD